MPVRVSVLISGGSRNSHDCPYCEKTFVKLPQHLKTVHNVTDNIELTRLTQEAKVVSSEYLFIQKLFMFMYLFHRSALSKLVAIVARHVCIIR